MARAQVERKIAAILAADVVGFSRMMEVDEVRTLDALKLLRAQVIEPLIAEHRGRTVKLMGDGMLVEFASVVEAVSCAASIQKKLSQRQADTSPKRTIVLRIGVNLGDVIIDGADLLGDGINIAARLEQLCEPGGVLISGTAYDQLPGKVKLKIVSAGEQRVKNIKRPIRSYKVVFARRTPEPPHQQRPRRSLAAFLTVAALLVIAGSVAVYFSGRRPAGTLEQVPAFPSERRGTTETITAMASQSPQAEPAPAPVPPPSPTPEPGLPSQPQPSPQPEPTPAPQPEPTPRNPPGLPQASPEPAPMPLHRPEPPTRANYGAISVSVVIPHRTWYSGGQPTPSAARTEALKRCRLGGGVECRIGTAFSRCGAVAYGNVGWGAQEGTTREAAEAAAIEACRRDYRGCNKLASQCVGNVSQ